MVLKSAIGPDVPWKNQKIQENQKVQEEVLIESPTGIAYGISDAIQSCLSSAVEENLLMVWT